jgi:LysM repeat protein
MRGIRLIPLIILVFMSIGLILLSADAPVNAQGENLITNSSFEGLYESYVPETPQELADCPLGICTTAQMPWGWKPWWVKERPTDVNPEFKPAEASAPGNRVHSGQRASQYFSFWSTHKAGLRQTVSVPHNSTVEFSVMGQAWMTESDTSLVSDYSGTANMRIGIDPAGGTNPYSPSVVWSEYKHPFDSYQPFAVRAQAQGETVTVFTFSAPSVNPNSPDYGFKHTDMYWDDASLVVVGAGSAAPPAQPSGGGDSGSTAPVAAPVYIPVPTSTPNAEGVIYTEVQPGDSLWAISARAGYNINDFLELNEITRDQVIRSGDLLITGFGDPPGEEVESEGEDGSSAAATETESETVSEPTPSPPPIPTETGPTVVEQKITGGIICLSAFDDVDQDTVRDESEVLRSAVAITISDGEQVISNYITDGESEPFCIAGLKSGSYRVTRSSLPNEALTTPGDYAVAVSEDQTVDIEFGSYLSENVLVSSSSSADSIGQIEEDSATSGTGALVDESDDSLSGLIIAGIVVGVLLLAGIVILILSRRRATT